MTEQTSVSTTWEIIILQILPRNAFILKSQQKKETYVVYSYQKAKGLHVGMLGPIFFQVKNPAPGVTYISDPLISFWHLYFTILIVVLRV